jgi:hypothetical protein
MLNNLPVQIAHPRRRENYRLLTRIYVAVLTRVLCNQIFSLGNLLKNETVRQLAEQLPIATIEIACAFAF